MKTNTGNVPSAVSVQNRKSRVNAAIKALRDLGRKLGLDGVTAYIGKCARKAVKSSHGKVLIERKMLQFIRSCEKRNSWGTLLNIFAQFPGLCRIFGALLRQTGKKLKEKHSKKSARKVMSARLAKRLNAQRVAAFNHIFSGAGFTAI